MILARIVLYGVAMTTFGRQMKQRAAWMAQYEELLVAARPELQGKVDWNTAAYLFNSGKTAEQAAAQYLANH